MPIHWLQALLLMLLEAWSTRRGGQIRFLKLQVELLRQKVPGQRVILASEDRHRLLKLGEALGHQVAYCLIFIHLGSRKIHLSPATYHPDEGWTKQQARNVAM